MQRSLRVFPLFLAAAAALAFGCLHRSAPPPPSAQGPDSTSRKKAFDEAVDSLHDQTHAPKSDIAGVTQDEATWNDSCLGCAKTGEKCSQVLIPGYRIVLRVRDATYEYHSDRSGRVRLCGQSLVPPPSS
jgi:hypothetical protein